MFGAPPPPLNAEPFAPYDESLRCRCCWADAIPRAMAGTAAKGRRLVMAHDAIREVSIVEGGDLVSLWSRSRKEEGSVME